MFRPLEAIFRLHKIELEERDTIHFMFSLLIHRSFQISCKTYEPGNHTKIKSSLWPNPKFRAQPCSTYVGASQILNHHDFVFLKILVFYQLQGNLCHEIMKLVVLGKKISCTICAEYINYKGTHLISVLFINMLLQAKTHGHTFIRT